MSEAFRGECLSLAAQLELYAKTDGILPGIVAAMQESAAALRIAAKPADESVQEAIKPFVDYFRMQESGFRSRGADPASMPPEKKLHSIPVSAWRRLSTLSTTGEPKR